MRAPVPPTEERRLRILHECRILDTPPERSYHDLTALAAHICETPVSLVSLVDRERQWFKAHLGIHATETTRDLSFCAHAILQRDVFIVPDALRDERFADNPLVIRGPKIRFYAAAPLVMPENEAIGTICVIDFQPRTLNDVPKQMLERLARLTVEFLQLRRLGLLARELLGQATPESP